MISILQIEKLSLREVSCPSWVQPSMQNQGAKPVPLNSKLTLCLGSRGLWFQQKSRLANTYALDFFFLRKINELMKSFVWQSFSFKTWGGRDINKDSWECRVGTPIFDACCHGHPQCYVLFLPPLAAHSKDLSW